MDAKELSTVVQKAQSSDQAAFAVLFSQYQNEAYNTALRITKNRTLAEDIVQETFVEVFSTIRNLQNPSAFGSWLKTIVHHQCTRYYRKKVTVHETLLEETDEGLSLLDNIAENQTAFLPDAALDQKEFRATIHGMIDQLPDVQSAALIMFYYDGLSLQQIAQVQDVSINTANTRLNRGRMALRKTVQTYEEKHDVRLHSVALLPLMVWLFQGTEEALAPAAATKIAAGISAATGAVITSAGAAAGTVGTVGASAAAGAGIGSKIAAAPLVAKLIAGILAVSVAIGVPAAIIHNQNNDNDSKSGHSFHFPRLDASERQDVEDNEEPVLSRVNYYDSEGNLRYFASYAYYDNSLLCSTTLHSVEHFSDGEEYHSPQYTLLYLYDKDGHLVDTVLDGLTISDWYNENTGEVILDLEFDTNGQSRKVSIYPKTESIEQAKYGVDSSKTEEVYGVAPVIPSNTNNKWATTYLNQVFGGEVLTDRTNCRLIYIDDNVIPELWIDHGYGYAGAYLYTQSNGNVDSIYFDHGGAEWIEKENLLKVSGGRMDVYYDTIYRIDEGQFVLVDSGDYGAADNSKVQIDSNGDPIYDYYWNDEKITKEEYEVMLKNAFDEKLATATYQNIYTYDQCKRLLQNIAAGETQPNAETEQRENLVESFTPEQQRAANIFMSNFAEQGFDTYPIQEDWQLLNFAYQYCTINAWWNIEHLEGIDKLSAEQVDSVLFRFFDRSIKHRSMKINENLCEYKDGYYYFKARTAWGEGQYITFAIVHEMYQNADGTYDLVYTQYSSHAYVYTDEICKYYNMTLQELRENPGPYYNLTHADATIHSELKKGITGTAVVRDYTKADGTVSYQLIALN